LTLCIAAECDLDGEPALLFCCDAREQTGSAGLLIGTDNSNKVRTVGDAIVLLAGIPTMADELIMNCVEAIEAFAKHSDQTDSDISITAFFEKLRSIARKRKTAIIAHHVEMRTGITFADFRLLQRGNFLEVWHEVDELTLGADLLIGCFADEPMIIRFDRFGMPHWEENYSAIGEGAAIARAFLCLQPWDDMGWFGGTGGGIPSLAHCLFRAYEAKTAAHHAMPHSVGKATVINVKTRTKRYRINEATLESLEEAFQMKHRVPRRSEDNPIAPWLNVESSWLEREDD
jgi:20S proteasome alpha/beta subunit